MKTLRRISDANKKLKSKQAIYLKFKNSNWKGTIITSMNEIIPWHFRWTHFDVPTTYISTKVVGVEQWRSKKEGAELSESSVADPGTKVQTYKWVKPVLFKVRMLSCFIVDFILRICTLILLSWRPRKVSCIMLYCFYYEPQYCIFFATNEPVNFMTSTMQSQAASRNFTTGRNFLFWSLHSWKSNWCQNKKYGDSKAGYLQRVSYSKRAWLEEITMYIASVFKVLQSCSARWSPESFTSQIIRQAQCLHVTKLWLWFARVHSVQFNISKSALHRLVCIISSCLGIKLS